MEFHDAYRYTTNPINNVDPDGRCESCLKYLKFVFAPIEQKFNEFMDAKPEIDIPVEGPKASFNSEGAAVQLVKVGPGLKSGPVLLDNRAMESTTRSTSHVTAEIGAAFSPKNGLKAGALFNASSISLTNTNHLTGTKNTWKFSAGVGFELDLTSSKTKVGAALGLGVTFSTEQGNLGI